MMNLIKQKLLIALLLSLLVIPSAFAASSADIMNNLSRFIPSLISLVMVFSYVSGMWMIFSSLLLFRKGAQGPMMGGQTDLKGPLTYLLVGSVLLYVASAYDIVSGSIFGDLVNSPFSNSQIDLSNAGIGSELFGYGNSGLGDQWGRFSNTLMMIVQFIGFISFIRGWFIIAKLGQSGGQQQASLGKGMTHIIGGVLAINMTTVVTILRYSAGIN